MGGEKSRRDAAPTLNVRKAKLVMRFMVYDVGAASRRDVYHTCRYAFPRTL